MKKRPLVKQDSVLFAPAGLELIDQGAAELERGEGVTLEEARKLLADRVNEWKAADRTVKNA